MCMFIDGCVQYTSPIFTVVHTYVPVSLVCLDHWCGHHGGCSGHGAGHVQHSHLPSRTDRHCSANTTGTTTH